MTDREVLQQFYSSILWADECREVTEGERTLVVTPCAIDLLQKSVKQIRFWADEVHSCTNQLLD
ncbi:hypothetical protein [Nostoc sp. MG11]|uniref:hypothetical protein n=1 Tax=Nostoc sp. MG11 TaxID=2721166 RepID=UPI001865C4B8|nr:hypothetical protein [Nostoc sp. MG11]